MAGIHKITQFGIIRHTETVWNREKRIQGQIDTPLTPEGEKQAIEQGRILNKFKWDRILVSDIGRAQKTAHFINISLQIPVIEDSRLREQHWGVWAGKTIAQIKKEAPLLMAEQEAAGWRFCPPGGEDRNMVWKRSKSALKEAYEKLPGSKILVITHEGVIKSLVYRLCRQKFLSTEPIILYPGYLHWLIHDIEALKIKAINALALSVT